MRKSIRHIWEKLKFLIADDAVFYSVLLIFVAIASFGLGRQSVFEREVEKSLVKKADIEVVRSAPQAPTPTLAPSALIPQESPETLAGEVVASKSGSKYHLRTCPGASQIKPENLISFASIAAAQSAGYTPAANCKF